MEFQTLRTATSARWLALCCFLAAFAYLPILNNGFIADDYAILRRVEILKNRPLYLFQVPPENFRLVSYFVFGAAKAIIGYHAWLFYAVNIGLHLTNILLLARLLNSLIADQTTVRIAVLLFAVFQAPQEAVMWLAAMNETTLFLFTLLALICWIREWYFLTALAYACALFSKESGIIIPVIILIVDVYREKPALWTRYLWLSIPTVVFGALFLLTVSQNFMLTNRSYAFGPHAFLVLGKSIHRLLWPWFYIMVTVVWARTRRAPSLRRISAYLALVIITMLPYMFIAYQTSLPSRQLYLASAVLMTMFAAVLKPLQGSISLKAVVLAFVVFNIGYLWLRKDAQFEERAAPTTELIAVLNQHIPAKAVIKSFAYPYPEIAQAAALAAPGWDPSMVTIDNGDLHCAQCLQLEWLPAERRYVVTTN